jgi:hypothetical protein
LQAHALIAGRREFVVGFAAAVLAAPLAAFADTIPPCRAPAGVVSATLDNGKAPAMLVRAIQTQIGPMARSGQPFNATDVVMPGQPVPGRRFILLWGAGPRWVIA